MIIKACWSLHRRHPSCVCIVKGDIKKVGCFLWFSHCDRGKEETVKFPKHLLFPYKINKTLEPASVHEADGCSELEWTSCLYQSAGRSVVDLKQRKKVFFKYIIISEIN